VPAFGVCLFLTESLVLVIEPEFTPFQATAIDAGLSPNFRAARGFSLLMNSRADLGARRVLIESAPRDQ
jgi:hypothetical protein